MHTNEKPLFRGVATALATPFSGGRVDIPALRRMLLYQADGGADAVVLCGTTGEAPTLTEKEMAEIVSCATETVGERLPLIVGVGTNCTESTLRRAKTAAALGASGLLVVTPYYNKGTKEGLVRHYLSVADAVDVPIIVYNVPTRTGVDISLDVLEALVSHPRIAGIKEAGGNFDKIAECVCRFGEGLPLYSGNDSQILPTLSVGGAGVISVVSNLLPRMTGEICRAYFAGRAGDAKDMQLRLLPLMRTLFAETNPAPLKAALAACELCAEELRLPLAPVTPELRGRLEALALPLLARERSM